jgi:hypothetical protein
VFIWRIARAFQIDQEALARVVVMVGKIDYGILTFGHYSHLRVWIATIMIVALIFRPPWHLALETILILHLGLSLATRKYEA